MKRKQLETYLYSTIGVAAMVVLLIGLNAVLAAMKVRVDVTKEQVHTLSAGTRAILDKIETPVTVRFYWTQVRDATPDSVYLTSYARQVEDLLDELRQAARGKLIIKTYNPQPDSDAEESAQLDGIEGQPLPPYGEPFYLGIAFEVLGQKVTVPFLSPTQERLLEYELARSIARVETPEKPVVGVMSALPIFGMPANPMMAQMGQQGGQEPWIFISELKRDFDVREVAMSVDEIDDAIKVLVVIHPRDISEEAQYAIDQFVLGGGKLLAFVDPLSIADNRSPGMNPLQRATASGSNMEKLLKAWSVEYDVGKVIADMTYKTMIGGPGGRPQDSPTVLRLNRQALNPEDLITSQIDDLLLPYAGVFTGTPAEGLTRTVLIHTSANSQLVDKIMAEFGGVDKDFRSSGTEYALGMRLTGKFKTAFPNGKPGAPAGTSESAEDKDATAASSNTTSLKESAEENSVILVADSDVLFDPVVARVQNFLGMRIVNPLNGNLNFGQSLVELLSGDSNLIAVRSRASLNRPFTVVQEMEAQAQEAYRERIRRLEESLQETQNRLNELQRAKEGEQRFILSPEQQAEVTRFRQQEAETKRDLRDLRKNLRKDVDALETRLTWINIAAMPFLVTLTGIAAALYKRKKTAAK